MKLRENFGVINLMRLTKKGADPDGWAKISPFFQKHYTANVPEEYWELGQPGKIRLTEKGKIALEALTR